MRKHMNMWNVFITAVVVLTAVWILPRSRDTTEQNTGPPDEAVSVQVDVVGLNYSTYDNSTMENNPDLALGEAATYSTYSSPLTGIDDGMLVSTEQEAVNWAHSVPQRMRPVANDVQLSARTSISSARWSGLLRMVSDTGSRPVPVV